MRTDVERRGKGFALAAAREFLRADPPDVVVVLDADCRIDRASLEALSSAAFSSRRACQAINLLAPDLAARADGANLQLRFLDQEFGQATRPPETCWSSAFDRHWHGAAVGVFDAAELGGSNIVEDLALGLHLARQAAPPLFVESANVWSPPATAGGTLVQRRRWEGGYRRHRIEAGAAGICEQPFQVRSAGRVRRSRFGCPASFAACRAECCRVPAWHRPGLH